MPNTEQDSILFLGIVSYMRNIILLGLTTTKNTTHLNSPGMFPAPSIRGSKAFLRRATADKRGRVQGLGFRV